MSSPTELVTRRRLELRGQVQGVGFRPFVYRLATRIGLSGFVANTTAGAVVEVEGLEDDIERFARALVAELPPQASIAEMRQCGLPPRGDQAFTIAASGAAAARRAQVTPDLATCPDCLRELFDPGDRRWRYPFINCTNCGPRYSIIRDLPYDRPATTMSRFAMCAPCQREYDDPADRRFHAQPNACPRCGPRLRLERADGTPIVGDPVVAAARLLRAGRIVAVKGIGGYHLACRADRDDVVRRLRQRKLRDGKPLAVMVPDVATAERLCRLNAAQLGILRSVAAPILLARKRAGHGLAPSVAEGSGDFGLMLPYAPVHHLLFAEGLGPLVMTSANISGEPLTFEDEDARQTLADVADALLMHDRPIYRPIDDSVVFEFRGRAVPIRRARGYVPQPLRIDPALLSDRRGDVNVLAVGAELKSTICLWNGREALLSEHLGELTHPAAYRHFVWAIERFGQLFDFRPQLVVHDLHPAYVSTEYARALGLPTVAVQHHHAHVLSVMVEWGEPGPVIGLACDGVGYGSDGAAWGCELLLCRPDGFERLGHLAYFPLVGGDRAAIETWRPAAALLRQALPDAWPQFLARLAEQFQDPQVPRPEAFERQLAAGVNCPPTSSLGRVFDAVAFILGLCPRNRHEAEGAMAVESLAQSQSAEAYSYRVELAGRLLIDLRPAVAEMTRDRLAGGAPGLIASRFHETVAQALAEAARRACRQSGLDTVALSGGCFANRVLLARLVELLEGSGLRVLYHRLVPPGDGGLALGQVWAGSLAAPGKA